MIVLDEDLQKPAITAALRKWYPGSIAAITHLRPGTDIDDIDIPTLLRHHCGCAFVTINWADFWQKALPDRRFAIICIRVPQDRDHEVPVIVRRLFRHPLFNSRRARCGKVILAAAEAIHYYDRVGGEVRSVAWR